MIRTIKVPFNVRLLVHVCMSEVSQTCTHKHTHTLPERKWLKNSNNDECSEQCPKGNILWMIHMVEYYIVDIL